MKTVILCGGKGTRMGENSEIIPKSLLKIGDVPMIEHIMNHYAHHNITEFVLCLGHLGEKIKDYFSKNPSDYKIEMIDTGKNTSKAQRLKKIKYLLGDNFFVSYGDDLSDVNISSLREFHAKEGKIATLTAVRVPNPYGVLEFCADNQNLISNFKEKPLMNEWINGGYFLFNKKIFDYINQRDELEKEVFNKLVKEKQISAYKHQGFWKSMNSLKDYLELNSMFEEGKLNEMFAIRRK